MMGLRGNRNCMQLIYCFLLFRAKVVLLEVHVQLLNALFLTLQVLSILFAFSSYKPIVEDALGMANAPETPSIVFQRPEMPRAELKKQDLDWSEQIEKGQMRDCVDVDSNDPLYILYTSGTTGELFISLITQLA